MDRSCCYSATFSGWTAASVTPNRFVVNRVSLIGWVPQSGSMDSLSSCYGFDCYGCYGCYGLGLNRGFLIFYKQELGTLNSCYRFGLDRCFLR